MEITQGNISTIAVWIYVIIAPYVTAYGITQELFVAFFVAVAGIILAVWSSKNPNTFAFLGNQSEEAEQ